MKLFNHISSRLALVALSAVALTACSDMIYDDEGDCAPYYKVRFEYRMHLEGTPGKPESFPDAFPYNVNSVTLYAVDANTGKIVWQKHESGDRVMAPGYEIDLPVDPGKYHLMAWCGEGHTTSFAVNATPDHIDDIDCRLNRSYESRADQVAVSRDKLNDLYHGREENLVMPDEQGVHYYTVQLTKNTNTVNIMLQQLSGEPMNPDDFDMEIVDTNGHLESDNTLRGTEPMYYLPWSQKNGIANIEQNPSQDPTDLGAILSEFTVSRIMATSQPRFTLYRHADGEELFSIPLKPYLLAFKGAYYDSMDDQEYLDRADIYNMVFFLDEGMRWVKVHIYINSFKLVIQNVDL